MPNLYFKKLRPDAIIPRKAHPTDAGIDFFTTENITLKAGERTIIHTGLAAIIPEGHALIIRDRSGLGNKGIHHLAGVIDQAYHGEILITIQNITNPWPYTPAQFQAIRIEAGKAVAQALLIPIPEVQIIEWPYELPDSERGTKGFGSSDTTTRVPSEQVKSNQSDVFLDGEKFYD